MQAQISIANTFADRDVRISESDSWLMSKKEIAGAKHWLPSVVLKIIGLANDLIYIIGKFYYNRLHPHHYSEEIEEQGDQDKRALVILLHGLNSNPKHMGISRRALTKSYGDSIAYLQPLIFKKGNCRLDDAAEKIHQQVLAWAQVNPGKSIYFAGVSNGARISAQVAARLKTIDSINNPIKVHAAAGPFFGTRMISPPLPSTVLKIWQWALKTPLFKKISNEFIDETSWGSQRSKELIEDMRSGADCGVAFSFYSSKGDNMVRSTFSAFPCGIKQAAYRMFTYQGHSSIIKSMTPHLVMSVGG